jgi:deoxyribonuclease V
MMITPGNINDLVSNALLVQEKLRRKLPCGKNETVTKMQVIGGADAAYAGDIGIGVIALLSFPGLVPIGYAVSVRKVLFPYIPGLFAFRELPLYAGAFEKLGTYPDLLMVNGHGYAHPRRFGLACQVGAFLDLPTIGIASRALCGTSRPPGIEAGLCELVMESGETIGAVVRTIRGKKPVFVSGGFHTDLPFAIRMTMDSLDGDRIPRPLSAADMISKTYRKYIMEH